MLCNVARLLWQRHAALNSPKVNVSRNEVQLMGPGQSSSYRVSQPAVTQNPHLVQAGCFSFIHSNCDRSEEDAKHSLSCQKSLGGHQCFHCPRLQRFQENGNRGQFLLRTSMGAYPWHRSLYICVKYSDLKHSSFSNK